MSGTPRILDQAARPPFTVSAATSLTMDQLSLSSHSGGQLDFWVGRVSRRNNDGRHTEARRSR